MRTLRIVLPIWVLSLVTFSQGQDLNKSVDYTTRAKPLGAVLADLSKQTGTNLTCTTDLDEEPLILKLSHVPLQEVMERIAHVVGGEWKPTDNGSRLESGPEAQALHEKAIQDRADFFRKSIDKFAEQYHCDQPFDDRAAKNWAEFQLAQEKGVDVDILSDRNNPAYRVLFDALRLLDLKEIASLHPGQVVDYSADPNLFERPLVGVEAVLQKLVENQNSVGNAYDQLLDTESVKLQRDFKGKQAVLITPKKLRLHIQIIGPNQFAPYVYISGYEGPMANIEPPVIGIPLAVRGDDMPHHPKRTTGQGLELSSDAKEIAIHIPDSGFEDQLSSDESVPPLSSPLKDAILHPTKTDPLSFATTDLVFAYAKEEKLNVVFCPTDRCEKIAYTELRDGPITPEVFSKEMYKDEMRMEVTDGCLLGTPRDPIEARADRTPRKDLETFLQSVDEEGYTSLDSCAEFELHAPRFGDRDLAEVGTRCLDGLGYPYVVENGAGWQRPSAAFYATLTPEQKDVLPKGKIEMNASTLSQEQLAMVYDWVQNANCVLSNRDSSLPPCDLTDLPNPDFGHSTLTINEEDKPMATLTMLYRGRRAENATSIESLAWTVAQKEDITQAANASFWDTDALRPGLQRMIWLKVTLPDGYELAVDLVDLHMFNVKPLGLKDFVDSLPSDLRKKYEDQLQKSRAALKEQAQRKQPPTNPPPPPL